MGNMRNSNPGTNLIQSQRLVVDNLTNSAAAGFRLEGFDNPALSLQTQLTGDQDRRCERIGKRHKRLILQRHHGLDLMRHFVDVADFHHTKIPDTAISPVEYAEVILFDTVQKLAGVCEDMLLIPVPQMWIGSSIALSCDSGQLPERSSVTEALKMDASAPNSKGFAEVYLFDWGRSDLNTEQKSNSHTQKKFKPYWRNWQRGALRLLYDSANLYHIRFGKSSDAASLRVKVWDYDTLDANDILGSVDVPLEPTQQPLEIAVDFRNAFGCTQVGYVTLEIFRVETVSSSRVEGHWQVLVQSVERLPRSDLCSQTDPMIECIILDGDGEEGTRAVTQVVWNDNNATFNHTLDFACAKANVMKSYWARLSSQLQSDVNRDSLDQEFEDFLKALPKFSHLSSKSAYSQRDPRDLIRSTESESESEGDN